MKKILGLDLGTASIGWALVNEAENLNEQSHIIKLGVRVIQYDTFSKVDKLGNVSESKNPIEDFASGKGLSSNAKRTKQRGARRNLQRFKLRRKNLIEILNKNQIISDQTPLTEIGKNTTHQTLELRAKAASEKISLEDFVKVLLVINKKRGYKSSRKSIDEGGGVAIDGMSVAKELYEKQLTPGQYVYELLKDGKKYIPEFYKSDLQNEFTNIWNQQKQYYSDILSDELYKELQGKNKGTTWKICEKPFNIVGIKLEGNSKQQKLKKYELRCSGLYNQLSLEHLAIVLQEINNDSNKSSGYLGAISDRSKELYFNKITVGQYLYHQIKENPHTSLKSQVFYRQDYLDEFEQIWKTQAKYHAVLTDQLKEEIRDIVIFYQRKLKSQKGLISFCQFESWEEDRKDEKGNIVINKLTGLPKKIIVGQRVVPKSSLLFQEFKIWQNLNNLQFKRVDSNTKDLTNQSIETDYTLADETKQLLFEELNIRGELSANEVLKFLGKKPKEWKCNFEKIEGNITNQALYAIYQKIVEVEGYGFDWSQKTALEIKKELKIVFPEIGINPEILDFDGNATNFDKQSSYQLWHLLYSAEDDHAISNQDKLLYGNANVNLKKKLETKYGFKPDYSKWLVNLKLQQDYGSLSSRAIRKILPHLQAGNLFSEACSLAGYNHSKSLTREQLNNKILKDKLELLPKNSLRNPVVEKILNQMVNLVNQVIEKYGSLDEIRIELARELKKSATERKEATQFINKRTKENDDIRNLITKEFGIPNPTKNDVIRYRLWEELAPLGYKSVFTGKEISPTQLFSKEIDIEHIIPKALLFDDSFSNKTLAYKKINLQKRDRTAIDFIESDFNSEIGNYKNRVEILYNNGKGVISKGKYKKLLMSQQNLPDGFIERDLRNSQYIAKKAKQMLQELVREPIVSTSGKITDKLREDWDLINVMKELNLPKYEVLGLTELEQRKNGKKVKVIKDWTKRNDHRHHAMDALTVAFTTHNHIQYLNNMSARKDITHKKHKNIIGIEDKIKYKDENGKKKFKPPIANFRYQAKEHIESILISFKAKNKVVTNNINKIKKEGGLNIQEPKTPRGQLHKETVYGRSKQPMVKPIKVSKRITSEHIKNIIHPKIREIIINHLEKFYNNIPLAFDTKTLKKEPLLYKDEPIKEVYCYEYIYTVRKEVNADNFKNEKSIEKVIDNNVKQILKQRLKAYNNKPKEAFSNLEKNPIWLNKEKGIALKRVTISGVRNAIPINFKKNYLGQVILSLKGKEIPSDFVELGNNHHIAIYQNPESNELQEEPVSFFMAVKRKVLGYDIVNKTNSLGWPLLFTLKQNEMFIFPDNDFEPSSIDLTDSKNYKKISKYLFRVQSISSKYYIFRHHLETTSANGSLFKDFKQMSNVTYRFYQNEKYLLGALKVRINHLGQIVQVGEY